MKALRCLLKILSILVILSLIFWTIVLGMLQTEQGRSWLISKAIAYLEEKTESQIHIGQIHFSFPLNLTIDDLSISQDNRPIISVQHLDLRCAYLNLFHGRLILSHVEANNIHCNTLFKHLSSDPISDKIPCDAPLLPFYVKLEHIDIQNIFLGNDLISALDLPIFLNNTSINIQGMVSNNPFRKSINAHLLISAKNPTSSETLPFTLGIDTQNHLLSFSFHSQPFDLNSLNASLPSSLKAHLALFATAPIKTWQACHKKKWQGNSSIEGHFKLTLHSPSEEHFLSSFIGQDTSVRSHFVLNSNHAIELFHLKLENPNVHLEGETTITFDQKIEQCNIRGEATNLQWLQDVIGKEIQGKVSFEGHASGFLNSPAFFIHCTSQQLMISQKVFQNINTTLKANPQNDAWNGFVILDFKHQNIPINMKSFFDWKDQKELSLHHIQAFALNSQLEGQIRGCAPDFVWDGMLNVRSSHVEEISRFLAIPFSGEGQLHVRLSPLSGINQQSKQGFTAQLLGKNIQGNQWQADHLMLEITGDTLHDQEKALHGTLRGEKIKWKDNSIEKCDLKLTGHVDEKNLNLKQLSAQWNAQEIHWPSGQAKKGEGHALFKNPLQNREGFFQFAFQDIHTASADLEEVTGKSSINLSTQWPFQINGRGKWNEELHFAAEGYWHYHNQEVEVASHLNGKFGRYPLQLIQPVHFLYRPDKIQISYVHLRWGEVELKGDYLQEGQNLVCHFKSNAVSSELFHYIAPDLPIAGHVTFEGNMEGLASEPKGNIEIDLHRMQINEKIFVQKPLIDGKIFLDLTKNGIQLRSQLNGIGQMPLLISGTIPITLSAKPFKIGMNKDIPLDLSLNAEGELASYLHLFCDDATHLSGQTKIALKLSGQFDNPKIHGHIDLLNGSYESISTGAQYHNIQGHLEGIGSKIFLKEFSAQDNKGSSITAKGSFDLDSHLQYPFEFEIHPSHVFILDSDYAAISASGPLTLVGNMKKSKLKGELTVDEAAIHLEEALPRQIKTVDVKYINVSPNDYHSLNQEKDKYSTVELEIKLHGRKISIEGHHLKSEWKGTVDVMGTPHHPRLFGELRINKGDYDFNGKNFNLTQGSIHFAGSPSKKTTLYVVASKEIDRINAEIIVKGPVNKPSISFRSNPPLSQREVLSYILFNRGISDITSDQGDQLSQSFMSLNSNHQKKGDDFLTRLRNNIGIIDWLDFTTNDKENKEIELQIGKNLTENISVTVNQGMNSISPKFAVEAKLRKNIKVQAEASVEEDIPVRMSLKWKKDY